MKLEDIQEIFKVLARKYAIEIIFLIRDGKRTPKEFKERLGITEGSLYQILNPLLDCGIIVKNTTKESAKRVYYTLTKKGEIMLKILELLFLIE